jgi:membrane AbrB-like protein
LAQSAILRGETAKVILAFMVRWLTLIAVTVGVTVPLATLGVPSAALFAALVVGIVLALVAWAPRRVPRRAGLAAQGALGVYIGTMVHHDAFGALGSRWPIVLAVAVGTLALSVVGGALLGLHRVVSPLTGALALVAGGASGLVAIARELGGDERVVAVVQYLRVALITASMPVVVTLVYHATKATHQPPVAESASLPWYLSVPLIAAIVFAGAAGGRFVRMPGAGLLGPMAMTIALELAGLSFGLAVPAVVVQVSYMLIGWQAGLTFTRESVRALAGILPTVISLIVALSVAAAGLGVVLSDVTGGSGLDGYLATSPGGIYAVLATAVETGSNVTFVIAAQVIRVLLMLFTAPLVAHVFQRFSGDRQISPTTLASREPIRVAD